MSDEVFGFDEINKSLNDLVEHLENETNKLLTNTATITIADTKERTPTKTGALRRSWEQGDIEGNNEHKQVELGSNISYASYVENGHKTKNGGYVQGQYMLKDSFILNKYKFEKKCKECLKQLLDGFKL